MPQNHSAAACCQLNQSFTNWCSKKINSHKISSFILLSYYIQIKHLYNKWLIKKFALLKKHFFCINKFHKQKKFWLPKSKKMNNKKENHNDAPVLFKLPIELFGLPMAQPYSSWKCQSHADNMSYLRPIELTGSSGAHVRLVVWASDAHWFICCGRDRIKSHKLLCCGLIFFKNPA